MKINKYFASIIFIILSLNVYTQTKKIVGDSIGIIYTNKVFIDSTEWYEKGFSRIEKYSNNYKYYKVVNSDFEDDIVLIIRECLEENIHWFCVIDSNEYLLDYKISAYENSEGNLCVKSMFDGKELLIEKWNQYSNPVLIFEKYIIEVSQFKLNNIPSNIFDCLKDTTISQYFKTVFFLNQFVSHSSETVMFSITDSLFADDKERQLFYFIVFTKSMNKSDGFYSEKIGSSALKYIKERTEYFAEYFNNSSYLTDNDFQNWVNFIWSEIQISSEHHEKEAILRLTNELKEKIRYNRKEYWIIIDDFSEKLKNLIQ